MTFEETFNELRDKWQFETGVVSDPSKVAMHPACQEIIGMGKPAISLILKSLSSEKYGSWGWFWVLRAITRENPLENTPKEEYQGKYDILKASWLKWGKKNLYFWEGMDK